MYALIHFIVRSTLARLNRLVCGQAGFAVLIIAALCGPAVAAAPSEPSALMALMAQSDQLRQLWQENSSDLWFFDDNGQQVIPTLDEDWVGVRFSAVFATGSGMPEAIRQFNQRYSEAVADFIYNPARPDLGLYRFKPTHRNGAINAILDGGDPTLRYMLPALIVNGRTQILGERINVRWKSQIRAERRRQLLHSVAAIDYAAELSGRDEVIQIDPCRMAAWKAANRLAEDVQVVSATPELLAVEAPVTVRFQIASAGAVAGAAIPFSLDIHFSDQVKIEPGTLANLNLKPTEIFRNLFAIDYDTPLSAVDVRHSPIQLRGRLYLYASGEFELPTIPVFYRDEGSDVGQIHRINTPPVIVRMADLVPEADGDYRLQVPDRLPVQVEVQPSPLSNSALWRALVAVAMLVIGLVVVLSCRCRHQQPQPLVVESTALQLLQQTLAAAADNKQQQGLASVGQALRRYLLDWAADSNLSLGGDVPIGGGSELFFHRLQPYAAQDWQARIQQTLQQLDDSLARGDRDDERAAVLQQVGQLVTDLEQQRSGAMITRDAALSD
ncbi:MAG: hypothetical protein J7K75_07550 [Desulfuromonas sp.]|nr:hypothetical protein [Desulfuromonas sp.]